MADYTYKEVYVSGPTTRFRFRLRFWRSGYSFGRVIWYEVYRGKYLRSHNAFVVSWLWENEYLCHKRFRF